MTRRSPRGTRLVILCLAFFMVILDSGIVVVALPSIGHDLRFSPGTLQWVLSAYLVPFGGLLLPGGRAADMLGHRRVFMAGAAVFTLASLTSGLAPSLAVLVGARAVQGISAAVMTPGAMSILMTTFAEGPERNRALGAWAAVGSLGGTAAWVLGGPLVSGLGWRWIFFVNIPPGLAVAALSPVLFSESRDRGNLRSLDLPGAVAITAGLTLFIYAMAEAPRAGWLAPRTVALLATSAIMLAVFAVTERRIPAPLAPARLFRSPQVLGGNLMALAVGMMAFGMPFTLTQFAQQVLGYSPLRFGLSVTVMPAMSALGATVVQRLISRRGPAPVAFAGITAMGLGCLLLTNVSVHAGYLIGIFIPLLIYGPGLGARICHRIRRRADRRQRCRCGPGLRAEQRRVPDRRRDRRCGRVYCLDQLIARPWPWPPDGGVTVSLLGRGQLRADRRYRGRPASQPVPSGRSRGGASAMRRAMRAIMAHSMASPRPA